VTESPREVLLEAVVGLLASMTGTRPFGGAYPNPPLVELVLKQPIQVTRHPYLGLIEESDSQTLEDLHSGVENDDFRFDVYGRMARTPDASARLWANRLRYDTKKTLRAATRVGGLLRSLADPCQWIRFGQEALGYNEEHADFILPCTARLDYLLAPSP